MERRVTNESYVANTRGEQAVLCGHVLLYGMPTRTRAGYTEIVARGACSRSLAGRRNVVALWNGDPSKPLGSTDGGQLKLSEDSRGLYAVLRPVDTTMGRELCKLIRSGMMGRMAIAFDSTREKWSTDDEGDPSRATRILLEVEPQYIAIMADTDSQEAVREPRAALEAFRRSQVAGAAEELAKCEAEIESMR